MNHNIEQAIETVTDNLSSLWHALYRRLLDRGFTETEAMDLLKTYIIATNRQT